VDEREVVVAGERCRRLATAHLTLDVALDVGPRILGLARPGGRNLFAELPDVVLDADGRPCPLYGGHRLWRAPEVPAETWVAEDRPVELALDDDGAGATVAAPALGGVHAALDVRADPSWPAVTVRHRLRNASAGSVRLAPWALSMLRPGGVAVLPLERAPTDPRSLQASSTRVVLWPYSDLSDPAVRWAADALVVDTGEPTRGVRPPNKLGVVTTAGWCAYVLDRDVLVVRAAPARSDVDGGATQQLFWQPRFVELETLGAPATLGAGEAVEHVERWELHTVAPGDDPVAAALRAGGQAADGGGSERADPAAR